jgi:ABC-type proline/glycine betaine transport system substrate-binding protein
VLRGIARLALPAALAVGSLALATGAPASAAAPSHATVAPHSVTWPGVVDSVNLAKHRFVFTWAGYRYTVTYTSKTKFTNGTAKKLKKGLHVTVTGSLKGSTVLAATKIAV